jgi:hypothetical protein
MPRLAENRIRRLIHAGDEHSHNRASSVVVRRVASTLPMLIQRLRGLLGTTIATCIPWTILGFPVGVVFRLGLIPRWGVQTTFPLGIVGAFTLAGAIVGIINGLVFSGLLFAAERGKTVDDLNGWRFATWGALATAATLGVISSAPMVAGIGAALGAVAAWATLATARRARTEASTAT